MNLHHLYYFRKLAKLEHYTKAAEELSITQPSLSHAIASLEDELGARLFEKKGRNIYLNKYGKLFLNYVQESLDILEVGIKKTRAMTSGTSGYINLAFIYTLGPHFVPKLVSRFLKTNPDKNIKFSFSSDSTVRIIQELKEEKYDIAFCSKQKGEENVEFVPVTEQELVLIVPRNHDLARKNVIDLKETISYPLITFSKKSGLRPTIDDLYKKIGEKPNIAYELIEDNAIAGLVAEKFGIAVIPTIPVLKYLNIKTLKIINPDYRREIFMATIKNKYLAPVIHEFRKFVMGESDLECF